MKAQNVDRLNTSHFIHIWVFTFIDKLVICMKLEVD